MKFYQLWKKKEKETGLVYWQILSLQDKFRKVQESVSTLIKAHLVVFYASGVKTYKKGFVSYVTVAYIPDHISFNLLPGVHPSYSRIIYAIFTLSN